MKKIFLFIACIFGSYQLGDFLAKHKNALQTYLFQSKEQQVSLSFFQPNAFPVIDHKFVIAIAGKNNGAFVDKTLKSVLNQKYTNFRVIYIDDGSIDGSLLAAQNVVQELKMETKVAFYQNATQSGYLANLLQVASLCEDDEILVLLGQEDQLSHLWVLQRLNQYFANPDLWMVLSRHLQYPSFKENSDLHPFDVKNIKKGPFTGQNLKAFYATVLKKMDPTDLMYQSQFMPDHLEISYLIPLLEMTEDHVHFIDEVLYLSKAKELDTSPEWQDYENYILQRAPYAPLTHLFTIPEQGSPL